MISSPIHSVLRDDIFWHKPTHDLTNPQYKWLLDSVEGSLHQRTPSRVTARDDIVYIGYDDEHPGRWRSSDALLLLPI